LFLGASGAMAQNAPNLNNFQQSQLKIISVKQNVFLGTSVYVTGQSLPNASILLSIEDQKGAFAYSVKTNSDSGGSWSANIDQSLKSDKYYVVAEEFDLNGLQIGSAKYGPVQIKGSFVFIVGVFSFLVIILLIGFVGGWYLNKLAEIKRYRRILISERDIASSYNILKNDVDLALKNFDGNNFSEGKINEIQFLLKRIRENLEKMNEYVTKGVKIIGKYDIITKIDNMLKF
jgi:hypothetical protein